MDSHTARFLSALAALVLFGILWHCFVQIRQIPPIILPGPLRVAEVAWQERHTLAGGFLATGKAALLGLVSSVLIGYAIAIVFSQSRLVRSALYPYVIFMQTVPIVAIAPLLITWFGYGFKTVVIVSGIISLFPIVSNVTAGLISVDSNLKDLFALHSASRWQTLLKLRIPNSVSHLILGIRVSTGLAVIGAIVGEFFVGAGIAGYEGLGSVMIVWQNRARTDALIGGILVSTLLGIVMLVGINGLARLLFHRWTAGEQFENE
ncbi:MAG: ABC transporter permease [Planctomycetales bacterium]|nr:ABC transporter permease [Planctomycetales bacterium]